MLSTKVTAGMWRIDPLNRSRVIDKFGRTVATAESEADASLIASAPDMYELLEGVENELFPHGFWEEVQFVLRRARGDIALIFSCCGYPKLRTIWNHEWLKFIGGLWTPPLSNEIGEGK